MIGELPVRVAVIEEAERVVEALSCSGSPPVPGPAEAPLADDRGAVAGVAQRHRDGRVLVAQRELAVAADPGVAGVQPGHQRGARRRADGAAGVVLVKRMPSAASRSSDGVWNFAWP